MSLEEQVLKDNLAKERQTEKHNLKMQRIVDILYIINKIVLVLETFLCMYFKLILDDNWRWGFVDQKIINIIMIVLALVFLGVIISLLIIDKKINNYY